MSVPTFGGVFTDRETSRNSSRTDWQRRLVAAPIALAALVLLIVAVPRTIGVILSARSEPVLRKLQDQQPVRIDELRTLADAQETGLFWLADGRLRTDLGLAYLLLAEKLPRGDANASAYLQQAIEMLKEGLGTASLCGSAGARLVAARHVLAAAFPDHRALRAAFAMVATTHDLSCLAGYIEPGSRTSLPADSFCLEDRSLGADPPRGRA